MKDSLENKTALDGASEEEMEQLQRLEEHFRKIDANNAKQSDEENILKAFKKRIADATAYLESKATAIQAHVRGVQSRAEVTKMLSKKKKGGGKKKKK